MKTSIKNAMATPLPRVSRYHWLRCGPPTQVDSTLWVGPKHAGSVLFRLQDDKILPEWNPVLCHRGLPRQKVARLVVVSYLEVFPIRILLE
jgi:hypothetical protein